MSPHKRLRGTAKRQPDLTAQVATEAAAPAVPALERYLNCAKGFWEAYRMRGGSSRRQALLALFHAHPMARLPVNNRWQANTVDADLQVLLKRGVLRQVREGGGRRHPMNKTSNKRQTYLVLA